MSTKYDQTIRSAPFGEEVYQKWLRMHRKECSEEFADFGRFYAWCIATGFTGEETLLRKDNAEPYSAENCVWSSQRESNSIESKRAKEGNKAVNRIRLAIGMCPVEEIGKQEEQEDA